MNPFRPQKIRGIVGVMSRRTINRAARLALLDRLGLQLRGGRSLFVLVEVLDQTIGFLAVDSAGAEFSTIKYREAKLFDTREEAEQKIADGDIALDRALLALIVEDPEPYQGAREYAEQQLKKPVEDRYGRWWLEEVRGEASWRAQPDTW